MTSDICAAMGGLVSIRPSDVKSLALQLGHEANLAISRSRDRATTQSSAHRSQGPNCHRAELSSETSNDINSSH